MPLPSPNLDDRTWNQLIREATDRIKAVSPEWTDLTPGDPGMALVDVFAYLTEALIYRLNRVPDKLFVEFLRLIGVGLEPPAAASVRLVFSRDRGTSGAVEIPRGTRVSVERPASAGGTEPPVFATADAVTLEDGAEQVTARAFNAELVQAEAVGPATGGPGLTVTVRRPPIVAKTGDPLDLVVAVEARPDELAQGDPAIQFEDRVYRIWREVENFTYLGADEYVYLVDRASGTILFGPEARTKEERRRADGRREEVLVDAARPLAAVPPPGRDIRVWYRRGGGPEGNVPANVLRTLKDPIAGVAVTNPEPATGGRAAETLENAMVRGPQELHTLSRAVTARDVELVAVRASGGVSRAKAVTQAELWRYATPGTVEVFLVPSLGDGEDPAGVTQARLVEREDPDALGRAAGELRERRPLGTEHLVEWARYKSVRVRAEIFVHREENADELARRVDRRLHTTVNPVPTPLNAGGWPFGQSLYTSSVYKVILAEPGVRYARGVKLLVDEVPGRNALALAADPFQDRTWYAGSEATFFRTLNDGDGWEAMETLQGETIGRIRSHPDRAGLVAIVSHLDAQRSRVSVSADSGATWQRGDPTGFRIEDLAWIDRDGRPLLLLATSVGLYQLLAPDAEPVQVLVDKSDQDLGFFAIAVSREVRGEVSVALGSQSLKGVYLSSDGGQSASFRHIGLKEKDVRSLAIQYSGPNRFLWAGLATTGGEEGEGALSWQLLGREDPVEGWRAWNAGWKGGSCWSIAFRGPIAVAGSHQAGVLTVDTSQANPSWVAPSIDSGLPQRDLGRFYKVEAVAADPDGRRIMACGVAGVFRTFTDPRDGVERYEDCSVAVFDEEVTIPPTWLLVNGANEITVTVADA